MESELASRLAATEAALRAAGATFAFVHGSVADGSDRAGSDLDVAAWWEHDAPPSFAVDLPSGVASWS